MNKKENWKQIENYPNYEVSNTGHIRVIKTGCYLKHHKHYKGHYYVELTCDKVRKKKSVHQLVALHHISTGAKHKFIQHIDGDRCNNALQNLKWVDRSVIYKI